MTALVEKPQPLDARTTPTRRRHSPRRFLPRSAWSRQLLSLVVVVVLVQGWNLTGFPVVSDDEGTYLAQAWAVQHGAGLAPYTYWYDHPPFGWLQIAALSWLPSLLTPGPLVVAHARVIMLLVSAVNVALLCTLGRRLGLPRWAALLAGALFALSPLSVTLQREIFLDNFAVLWMLAAFVLALSPRRNLWHHVAAGCAAALAVLSKETMLVVLPGLVVALWQGSHTSTRKFSGVGFGTAFALLGVLYPLYAMLKNELLPGPGHVSLVGGLLFQTGRAGSGSILAAGTGSHGILLSWLYYDPVLILAGVPAVVLGLLVRRLRAPALAGALLVLVSLRPNGYLPAMYVIQALPFFAVALAGLVAHCARIALAGHAAPADPAPARGRSWAARRAVVAVAALVLVTLVVPRWYAGDQQAMTVAADDDALAATRWIAGHLPDPADRRIVVDDALWLDMVHLGFRPGLGAIWFYKLDRDPAVLGALPRGWRSVDYVLSTPIMRQALTDQPNVAAVLTHSTVLATFGTGDDRIEVRQVAQDAP